MSCERRSFVGKALQIDRLAREGERESQIFDGLHYFEHELLFGLEKIGPDGGYRKAVDKYIQTGRAEVVKVDQEEIVMQVVVRADDFANPLDKQINFFGG